MTRSTHLVVDLVESLLQLSVDSGQLLEVSVGLVDGQKDLVHFIDGFVHGSLWWCGGGNTYHNLINSVTYHNLIMSAQ